MFVLFRDYNNSKYIQTELSNQGKVITNLLFSDIYDIYLRYISFNICLFGLFRIVTSAGYKQKNWEKLGLLDLCELAVQQQDNLDNSLLLRQYEEGEDQMHDDEELRIHSSMKYFQ